MLFQELCFLLAKLFIIVFSFERTQIMKSYLKVLATLVTILIVCGLVVASEPNSPSTEPNTPTKTAANIVAATVNGVDITEADVENEIVQLLRRRRIPPQLMEQYKKQLRQPALENLIDKLLLDEKIKQANIVVTEEEITEQIKKITSRLGLSVDEFKEQLKNVGTDFDQWKKELQFERSLGYQKFFEAKFADKVIVTEDEAKNYYSENETKIEQIRASHILIRPDTSDPNTDPNQAKAKAKLRAQELLKQLQNGADFAELAKANSADPGSASAGGDLGFFERGKMVAPFENAAFELKVNQLSDVVETQFGYHIIKVTDRKNTFEQFKDDIMATLKTKKLSELSTQYVESLRADANIVYPKTPPGKDIEPNETTVP